MPASPPRPPVRRGFCGAGPGPCGAANARLFPMGWRADCHLPGIPVRRDLTPLVLGGPLVLRLTVDTHNALEGAA